MLALTTLYIVVCLILTGVTRYSNLDKPEAMTFAILYYVLMKFRKMYQDSIGGFNVPLYPVVPILGIATCTFLIINLDLMSWISYALWLVIGSIIYFTYYKKTILS